MSVTLAWTTPTKRVDGSALALSDLASATVSRDGVALTPITTLNPTMTFVDTAATPGSHVYTVVNTGVDGSVSAASNSVSITVTTPAPSPPEPVTDLSATQT